MTKNDPSKSGTPSRSKAAVDTKQIWVKGVLHQALSAKAVTDQRTIRVTVERMLVNQLGYDSLSDLEQAMKNGKFQKEASA